MPPRGECCPSARHPSTPRHAGGRCANHLLLRPRPCDTREVGTKFFGLSYFGLSESLSQKTQFEGGDERRWYDYSSALERVGTARKPDGVPGEAPYRAYSLDANGSVEGLQDSTGEDSSERYSYDPYGEALDSTGGPQDEADLSPDQQANPFRFEGHYYDAAFKTYDMRARAYLPEVGRFLQEDHYEQALGDQALETDPLTQDRYAFAGGNPTNNIEFDGHRVCNGAHDCGGSSEQASRRNSNFQNQKAVFSPGEQIQWNRAVNEGAREARGRAPRNGRAAAVGSLRLGAVLPSCTPGTCDPEDHNSLFDLLSATGGAAAGVARGGAGEAVGVATGLWDSVKSCNAITNTNVEIYANGCNSPPSLSQLERHYLRGDPSEATGRLIVGFGGIILTRRPSLMGTARGDLTRAEHRNIQKVVDEAGRPLTVVGSAARGQRRGVGSDLPAGKGPGTRSDIDYLVPPSQVGYFRGLESRLPGIDPKHGLIIDTFSPFQGPGIRFEPRQPRARRLFGRAK